MAEATTVIASGTAVRGHIHGAEELLVQGMVQGSIRLAAGLTVDTEGRVDATVEVVSATIHGIVVGRIVASDFVELASTARMQGEVVAPRVILRDGALFAGLIDMGDLASEQAASPAVTAQTPPRPSPPAAPPARPAAAPPSAARPAASAFPGPRPFPSASPTPAVPTSRPPAAPLTPAPVVAAPAPVQADAEAEAEPELAFDDEPELPDAAAKKQVAVKKRK